MSGPRFAVHHQCFRNKSATEFALSEFIKFNNDIQYFLYSDAGDDFSDVAKRYGLVYNYSSINVGHSGYTVDQLLELFKRIRETAVVSSASLILWMEDDVLTRGKINVDVGVESSCIRAYSNKLFIPCLQLLEEKYGIQPSQNWWGMAGGSLLNADLFRNRWPLIEEYVLKDYPLLVEKCGNKICYGDICLQMVHLIADIPCVVGKYVAEYRSRRIYDPRRLLDFFKFRQIPMLHNYKKFY